jgi:hypothetical protein
MTDVVMFESGQIAGLPEVLEAQTDKIFTDNKFYWSGAIGKAPKIDPDGVINGLNVVPAESGLADAVDILPGTYNRGGVKRSHSGFKDLVIARGVGIVRVGDIVMDATDAITSVMGITSVVRLDHTAAIGISGGPSWLATGTFGLGRIFSKTGAVSITVGEIRDNDNQDRDRADSPTWNVFPYGAADAGNGKAFISFDNAPRKAFSGDGGTTVHAKNVWAVTYSVVYTEVKNAKDFVRSMIAGSSSSNLYYDEVINTPSKSLTNGSFTARVDTGMTDLASRAHEDVRTVKHIPDQNRPDIFSVEQGAIFAPNTNPAEGPREATVTILSPQAAVVRTG